MLLDIQNTAILQIKSCSKYCFSADGVQEIEKEIEDLREKFRGSGDGGHLPYFERFLSNNEKKSKQIAKQELAALYEKIEQRMEDGENTYDVHHLNEYENDFNALVRTFTAMRGSKVGPEKADAFLDLVEERLPQLWQHAVRNEASPSRQQDKSIQKEIQKKEVRLKKKEDELVALREEEVDEMEDLMKELKRQEAEAKRLAEEEQSYAAELETCEEELRDLGGRGGRLEVLEGKIAAQDQALEELAAPGLEAAAEMEGDSDGPSPRDGDASSASRGSALKPAPRGGPAAGGEAGRKPGEQKPKAQHCGTDCAIF